MSPNATSSVFLPSPQEVVAIESYNSMGGTGVSFVALQHPSTGLGIVVDDRGAVAEVPEERWSEFLAWVAEAKENLKVDGGGSWSRPQYESCPTDMFYDLGPAATKGTFVKFQLSGHEVYGDEPDAILQYVNEGQQIVSEIPPALVKVESAILALRDDLLPKRDYSRPRGLYDPCLTPTTIYGLLKHDLLLLSGSLILESIHYFCNSFRGLEPYRQAFLPIDFVLVIWRWGGSGGRLAYRRYSPATNGLNATYWKIVSRKIVGADYSAYHAYTHPGPALKKYLRLGAKENWQFIGGLL
ncbi:hypothetical protein DFH08DRAFT_817592 [Mycena albidolilacea]|uniref:Uncharacterized protein n=1 Tax=Mycena albidolilacea TaxID=1033008 RepID=A0AAD6ZJ04_9AGAR|nr:hypothetical protein DFH08DRAFT_817592 [Mycena albidolilacea]